MSQERSTTATISRPNRETTFTPGDTGGIKPPTNRRTAGWDGPDENPVNWRQQINQILADLKF